MLSEVVSEREAGEQVPWKQNSRSNNEGQFLNQKHGQRAAAFLSDGTRAYTVKCPNRTSDGKSLWDTIGEGKDPSCRISLCKWSLLPLGKVKSTHPQGGLRDQNNEKTGKDQGARTFWKPVSCNRFYFLKMVWTISLIPPPLLQCGPVTPIKGRGLISLFLNLTWPRDLHVTWRNLASSVLVFCKAGSLDTPYREALSQNLAQVPDLQVKKPPEDSSPQPYKSSHQNPQSLWGRDMPRSLSPDWLPINRIHKHNKVVIFLCH